MTFNKCYFIILEEKDSQDTGEIVKKMSEIFKQFPIFTIILWQNEHLKEFSKSGNYFPLVLINPLKVKHFYYKITYNRTYTYNFLSLSFSLFFALKKTQHFHGNL